ncbi:MAG: hypothetical protein IJ685_13610, partial [Selenomonadaceae bacterium]|nr:hypothetical protein [Selenomonadaceae bacterium]
EAQRQLDKIVDETSKQITEQKSTVQNESPTENQQPAGKTQTATMIDPFDVEIPQNPSEEFNNAYREMQETWDAYRSGEIDIREAVKKVDKIIRDYQQNRKDPYTSTSGQEFIALGDIQRKIEDVRFSPEEQAKHNQGWENFHALKQKINALHKAGSITDKDFKKINDTWEKLARQVQQDNITGQTAYERFKAALPAGIKAETEKLEFEEATANVEKSSTSKRIDDGYRDVEPAVRRGTDEETRTQGRVESVDDNSGRERQTSSGLGENATRPNAENARPVQADDAGSTSARTGTETDRGNDRVSADAENVSDESTKTYEPAGNNFHITEDDGIGEGGLKTKFKQNIDAIKLLKQLEAEVRKATPSEQKILAKFNGWGTVAPAFSNTKGWTKENQQLRELLTPEEYEAARAVTLDAFYTSPEIAKTIWSGLEHLGFKGGRILDPSTGSGIFFGTMPSLVAV